MEELSAPRRFVPYLQRTDGDREVWSLRTEGEDGRLWRAGWEDPFDLEADVRPLLPWYWPCARVKCRLVECSFEVRPEPGTAPPANPYEFETKYEHRYNVDIFVPTGSEYIGPVYVAVETVFVTAEET